MHGPRRFSGLLLIATACGGRSALDAPSEPSLAGEATAAGGHVGATSNSSGGTGLVSAPQQGGRSATGGPSTVAALGGMLGFGGSAQGGSAQGGAMSVVEDPQRLVATGVSAGASMTCAIIRDGSVWCWGKNDGGQLGDGTTRDSPVPVRVKNIDTAKSVIAGGTWNQGGRSAALSAFACAILEDATLHCWGHNGGVFGDTTLAYVPLPIGISGLTNVLSVAPGDWHACALTGDQGVLCWGNNQSNELGGNCVNPPCLGSFGTPRGFTGVSGLDGATSVVGQGSLFSCAVLGDGSVQCWGELGPDPSADVRPPTVIAGVSTTAAGLSAGYRHACAIASSDGSVQCWGSNDFGELGSSGVTDGVTPVRVLGLRAPVAAVSAGHTHSCAVLVDGTVQCWGSNVWGESGEGSATTGYSPGLSDIVAVSAGFFHTCALTRKGSVICWGINDSGELGDGKASSGPLGTPPVTVTGF